MQLVPRTSHIFGRHYVESRIYRKIAQQKLASAGQVLRVSGGRNALVILDGKIKGKKAKGRPKRMWFDDIRQWTMTKRLL